MNTRMMGFLLMTVSKIQIPLIGSVAQWRSDSVAQCLTRSDLIVHSSDSLDCHQTSVYCINEFMTHH